MEKIFTLKRGEIEMHTMFQIEYDRNAISERERELAGDKINIEMLSCIDLSTNDGKELAHELLDEFILFHNQYPETAKIWFGGVCQDHPKT